MKTILSGTILGALALLLWTGCDSGMDLTGPDEARTGVHSRSGIARFDSENGGSRSASIALMGGMPGHYFETLITREAGGTLLFKNGRLDIEPMSIDATKVVGARTYSLQQRDFFKRVYEFDPSGTTFNPPARLTLNYCDLGPVVPDTVVLRVFNEQTNEWEIASYMVNDPVNRTFTGTIEHFSRYSLSGNGQVLRPQIP